MQAASLIGQLFQSRRVIPWRRRGWKRPV